MRGTWLIFFRTPQMAQVMQQRMQQQAQQMQRDGSNMEMGGQRAQSPAQGDNAGSPSKRPRTDGNGFNGQPMGPAGRGQGMPGQQFANAQGPNGQMMLQNGINPGDMPQGQMGSFQAGNPAAQNKSLEVYSQSLAQSQRAALSNQNLKAMNMAQSSPMAQPNRDSMDFQMGGGAPGQQQGNHALQDYQMQLMLLEQQNKKRLLMARQEQDNLTHAPQGNPPMGGQGPGPGPGFAPAMSPQGSRAGPSPNPNEQMKRGTPKMGPGVMPGSPMPDGSMQPQRGSPVPGFDPSQMQPGMMPGMPQMGPNGMMRPPSSNPAFNMNNMTQAQMEMMARSNGGRMPNGAVWQGGPPQQMVQQNPGQPPAPMGTPQQRNTMPPPPAPAAGGEQRTQPSSPAQPPAPPTPSQANKANPKAKKDAKDNRKVSLHFYLPVKLLTWNTSIHPRRAGTRLQHLPQRQQKPQHPLPPPPSRPRIQVSRKDHSRMATRQLTSLLDSKHRSQCRLLANPWLPQWATLFSETV